MNQSFMDCGCPGPPAQGKCPKCHAAAVQALKDRQQKAEEEFQSLRQASAAQEVEQPESGYYPTGGATDAPQRSTRGGRRVIRSHNRMS